MDHLNKLINAEGELDSRMAWALNVVAQQYCNAAQKINGDGQTINALRAENRTLARMVDEKMETIGNLVLAVNRLRKAQTRVEVVEIVDGDTPNEGPFDLTVREYFGISHEVWDGFSITVRNVLRNAYEARAHEQSMDETSAIMAYYNISDRDWDATPEAVQQKLRDEWRGNPHN